MALKTVLLDELRDMYSAENQLVKALPKLAKGREKPETQTTLHRPLGRDKGTSRKAEASFRLARRKANRAALQRYGRCH